MKKLYAGLITIVLSVAGWNYVHSASTIVNLCSYSGIDNTGVSDSMAAFKSAVTANTVTGTNPVNTLYINCKIKLSTTYIPTAPIFFKTGMPIMSFGPSGEFDVDNSTIGTFYLQNVINTQWIRPHIRYVGSAPINNNVSPYISVPETFNDTQMKADLVSQGYTMVSGTGASSYWAGPTNAAAIFVIRGTTTGTFQNGVFDVAAGTNAANFIPVVFSIDGQWTCCTVTTNGNPLTATYAKCPKVTFDGNTFDGYWMGYVGTCGSSTITNQKFLRYSDLQATDGSNPGGVLNSGIGQFWFAPPHAIYFQDGDGSFVAHNNISYVVDYGVYVGGSVHRSAGSGSLVSLKVSLTNGTIVNWYSTARPDGCEDVITNYPTASGTNGTISNFICSFDSTTATYDGTPVWGTRWPSSNPTVNVTFSNYRIIDTATSPIGFPVRNMYGLNSNVKFQKFFIYQHVKSGTFPQLNGTNISSDMTLYLDSCSGGRPAGSTNNPGTVYGC